MLAQSCRRTYLPSIVQDSMGNLHDADLDDVTTASAVQKQPDVMLVAPSAMNGGSAWNWLLPLSMLLECLQGIC